MADRSRLETLLQMVRDDPEDAFSRYALALEYKKLDDTHRALTELEEVIRRHPDYAAAYFMAGQYLEGEGRRIEAAARLREGIGAARRSKDQHALSEMQDFLESLNA
ncbi:MAG: hypothetical protein ACE15F_19055 [bacterium]